MIVKWIEKYEKLGKHFWYWSPFYRLAERDDKLWPEHIPFIPGSATSEAIAEKQVS